MRQMVLVCDDSCNSFSSSPPPLFFPLGFPLVSPLFFAPKRPHCATWVERAWESGSWASWYGHQAPHLTWLCTGAGDFLLTHCTACKFDVLSTHKCTQSQSIKVGKLGPTVVYFHSCFSPSFHTQQYLLWVAILLQTIRLTNSYVGIV